MGSIWLKNKVGFGGVVLPFVHLPENSQKVKNYMKQDTLEYFKLVKSFFFLYEINKWEDFYC